MQKIQKMFCPNCGAPITFQEGRDDTFCMHCGTQCFKEDSQLEMKYKHEEAMTDKAHKKDITDTTQALIFFIVTAILFIISMGMIMFMFAFR